MSLELPDPTRFGSDGLLSREYDCYTLHMKRTAFSRSGTLSLTHAQALSGLLQFHHLRVAVVVCAVLGGERPGKPPNSSSLSSTHYGSCYSRVGASRP